jgi:glycine cleavage system aminomethyltransferase T
MTSGGYGYTVKQSIAYGYLPVAYATPGTDLEVLWFGERVPLVVTREPLYDPANQRVKEVSAAALKR